MPTRAARPAALSEAALALVAQRFRVLADPTRLRLLHELMPGERAVQDLAERTGLPQPTVSKQLAVLRAEGIVARRPQGLQAFYRVSDRSVASLCDLVCRGLAHRLSGELESLPPRWPAPARVGAKKS